jgi:hypothetical protein
MSTPVPSPPKILAAVLAVIALAGCESGPSARPVPSVAQIGSELKCLSGDHGFSDNQAGWGFCYPGTWQYRIRAQGSQSPAPRELDPTFDIIDVPCSSPSAGATARPVCASGAGLFAFMIVSTYERGNFSSLAAWEKARLPKVPDGTPIRWGNALEASKLADGRRIALTATQVVILDLHSIPGNLDLEAAMSTRLDTWKFIY